MRSTLVAALVALGFASSAYAQRTVTVIITSDPPSATLSQYGGSVGMTPMSLKYPTTKAFTSGRGCLVLQPLSMTWASGATAEMADLKICPEGKYRYHGKYQLAFARPDVPGREIDAIFALQVQRDAATAQAQQQAANAAATAAAWAAYVPIALAAIATRPIYVTQPIIYPPTVHCSSTVLGPFINTSCR